MFYHFETYNYEADRDYFEKMRNSMPGEFLITSPGINNFQMFSCPNSVSHLANLKFENKFDFYKALFESIEKSIVRVFPFQTELPSDLIYNFAKNVHKSSNAYNLVNGEEIGLSFLMEKIDWSVIKTAVKRDNFYVSGMQTNYLNSLNTSCRKWIDQEWRRYFLQDCFGQYFNVPSAIALEISNICNLKCIKCPYHSKYANHYPNLKWAERSKLINYEYAIDFIDQISAFEPKPTLFLCGDGEPLMHPQFRNIVVHAKRNKFNIVVTTNGTLLKREIVDFIEDYGVHLVISLDSLNATTYNKVINNFPFETIIKNIDYLISRKLHSEIWMAFVDMPEINGNEWDLFSKYWLDKKIGVKRMIECNLDGTGPKFVFKNNQPGKRLACVQPFTTLRITTDGRQIPCCAEKDDALSVEWLTGLDPYVAWKENLKGIRRILCSPVAKHSYCEKINCSLWRGGCRHVWSEDGVEYSLYETTEEKKQILSHIDMTLNAK